jgi:fluoride ion exporter CrcB/FEX
MVDSLVIAWHVQEQGRSQVSRVRKRSAQRKLKVLVVVGLLVGLTTLATGADGECTSEDKTFCIAQHPSPTVAAAAEAAGGVYADAGLPFIIPQTLADGDDVSVSDGAWQEIWPGTPDGKRALVTVCLMGGSGGASVRWTEGEAYLDPGDSITVFSTHVEVGGAVARSQTVDELTGLGVAVEGPGGGLYIYVPAVYGTYTITLDLCG